MFLLIMNEYQKKPASGVRPMSEDLLKAIDEAKKTKFGAKRKVKAGPSEPTTTPKKKIKKAAQNPKSPSPVAKEDSGSHTVSEVRRSEQIQKEVEDTIVTS